MVPREEMDPAARKLRDTYARVPGISLFKREFGYYCLERWREQGMPQDVPMAELFDYDPPGNYALGQLGWCEAAFQPAFEVKVIEDRGDYELEQDHAGRSRTGRRGRRSSLASTRRAQPDTLTWRRAWPRRKPLRPEA